MSALTKTDFHFDFASCEVQVQRDDGVTRTLSFTDELVDFGLLEQKLARTDGVGFNVSRGGRGRPSQALRGSGGAPMGLQRET